MPQVGCLKSRLLGRHGRVSECRPAFWPERYSERGLLVAGTLLAGAAFAGMATASGFFSVFIAILVVGFGSAVQHPLASAIISQTYPAERRRSALPESTQFRRRRRQNGGDIWCLDCSGHHRVAGNGRWLRHDRRRSECATFACALAAFASGRRARFRGRRGWTTWDAGRAERLYS